MWQGFLKKENSSNNQGIKRKTRENKARRLWNDGQFFYSKLGCMKMGSKMGSATINYDIIVKCLE